MVHRVPLVHRVGAQEAAQWIATINERAVNFELCLIEQMSQQERDAALVAVVANPDPAELERLPNLIWVQGLWAGVERLVAQTPPHLQISRMIDPQLCKTMAEAVLAWTLYLHRDMPAYAQQQRRHEWQQHPMVLAEDRKVAIFGTGLLGMAAGELLARQGFDVCGWSRSEKPGAPIPMMHGPEGRTELLARSDIIVVLLPLTESTRGLFGRESFAAMKEGASIINFGRGQLIDTEALIEALDSRLGHAVLDVFAQEPLPADNPLWDHPQVTILPHISGPTNIPTSATIAARNLDRFITTGEQPEFVNRERGY